MNNYLTLVPLVVVIISVFAIFLFIIMTIIKQNEKQIHYDNERNMALIGNMRASFEKALVDINTRLLATEDRWMDVNHLLITTQKNQELYDNKKTKLKLNNFLKSAGLSEEDLCVDNKLAFILTPFNLNDRMAYDIVKKVCDEVGLKCIRGDEDFISGDIFPHVLKKLVNSNIVIANIDGRNPNVFYELGLAHAMDKRTIIISRSKIDFPIDVKSKKIILYDSAKILEKELKNELIKLLLFTNDYIPQ